MLKQTITYKNFEGVEKTIDAYFNLTKSELFEMEVTGEGNSLQEHMKKIMDANDGKEIMRVFKEVLAGSYGVRSEDGERFIKSSKLFEEFSQTLAYDKFFFELVTDAEKMAAFFNGVVPSELNKGGLSVDELKAQVLEQKGGYKKPEVKTSTVVKDLPTVTEGEEAATAVDISKLSREELEARLRQSNG